MRVVSKFDVHGAVARIVPPLSETSYVAGVQGVLADNPVGTNVQRASVDREGIFSTRRVAIIEGDALGSENAARSP
jgi:hypothetical protein